MSSRPAVKKTMLVVCFVLFCAIIAVLVHPLHLHKHHAHRTSQPGADKYDTRKSRSRFGVNWGMITSHPLNPRTGVALVKSYGFGMVKLFAPHAEILNELAHHPELEIMVACENNLLSRLGEDPTAALAWVREHVVPFITQGANIKYIAVGNEPFLKDYGNSFVPHVVPTLQNMYEALKAVHLEERVRLTTPLNGDVMWGNLPSEGQFRPDIKPLVRQLLGFLETCGGAFTVNLYPFLAVYQDSGFPLDYAFPGSNHTVVDGAHVYTNVFQAQIDMLLYSFAHEGLGQKLPIIVGEIGWPTSGFKEANVKNAQKFNQELVNFVESGAGTPLRPNLSSMDIYLFGLADEDQKSTAPGWFEPYWGLADASGVPKYPLVIKT